MKNNAKEKAIELRKLGLSYREIMDKIPIAKSTLSDWLRSIGLVEKQKQRITQKKLDSAKKGGAMKHQKRLTTTNEIINQSKREVGGINQRELWLIGVMLYWAEGSKEKEYRPGSGIKFTNSDPDMIIIFLRWLKEICGKTSNDLRFDIYIHENHRYRKEEIIDFWAETIGLDQNVLQNIYYKKGNPKTLRKNIGESYHGIMRVSVKTSSPLLRRIAGWTRGVVESIR